MSIDRLVVPELGVTVADFRDALALLDGWQTKDATRLSKNATRLRKTAERADGVGVTKCLIWLLAETIDAMDNEPRAPSSTAWLTYLHARLEGLLSGRAE